ncbi:hypothetical protein YIM_20805 [Amycolatopsis sp. YIM 10]|nr:hypothetical protein YIM_20805 [Amycolatopsis sp. YIM 10]
MTQSSEPPPKQAGTHRAGDCLAIVDNAFRKIGCEAEHQAEVIMSDHLPPGFAADYPPSTTPVAPTCRAEMARYLGSQDVPATRLEHRVLWPTAEEWTSGARWFACAIMERDPENKAAKRTGSLAGALSAGLGSLRKCYTEDPLAEGTRVVGCDQPHRSEATPRVIPLGSHTDPAPAYEESMKKVMPRCETAVATFLDGKRPDATPGVILPATEYWASGATTGVCYIHTPEPVTGTLSPEQ